MMIDVSSRTISVVLIQLFAAFGDNPLQFVGFLARERTSPFVAPVPSNDAAEILPKLSRHACQEHFALVVWQISPCQDERDPA